MASGLLMSLMVIGQFIIWLFWMDSINFFEDGHPTSFCNIIALSATLISCMLQHDVLLSTVLRDV